jgi:hypothetical protein
MAKSKREIVLAALHAYADPFDPDEPCHGHEVLDRAVEFLETFAGLDLDACSSPKGKTYKYDWLLQRAKWMFGELAPHHCVIQFFDDLGLIRTELIDYDSEDLKAADQAGDSKEPMLPGVDGD